MIGLPEQNARREFGYLALKDGTRLAYVIWLPAPGGRYPAVLNYSAYEQAGAPFDRAKRFLEAGYAFVGANVRGTGASGGSFSYFQPIEGEDGAILVEWIAEQNWCSGHVGMVGASYGAHTQIAVAAHRPPHLRAIVPMSVDGCEYRDEAMTGGLFNCAMLADWTLRVQPELTQIGTRARVEAGDAECLGVLSTQRPNRTYEEARQHPLYDSWWKERSLDTLVARVSVPTLFVQAWQDEWIRPNGALQLFKSLNAVPKRLCLQNGPHRLGNYELNKREELRWLNRWVKGQQNGVEAEERVIVHWEAIESRDGTDVTPAWSTNYSDWPVSNLRWVPLYLRASGELCSEPPVTTEKYEMRCYVNPLGTELFGNNEQFRLEPHPLGTLRYRTKPMSSDFVILGAPQLTFFFSTDQVDTDFMFTLKDVDPLGNILFLQRSFLRASLMSVDRESSTPDEIVQSFRETTRLIPGEVYEVTLSLSTLGHVVREGHQLELSFLSPNAVPSPVWGFAASLEPSVTHVYHGAPYPSRFLLPVAAGERARQSAPPLGSLRNQPYRTGGPTLHAEGPRLGSTTSSIQLRGRVR